MRELAHECVKMTHEFDSKAKSRYELSVKQARIYCPPVKDQTMYGAANSVDQVKDTLKNLLNLK